MTTLRLPEAARLLGMSPVTLRKRAAAGMVPAYKPGRAWVFLEEELLAYLKSKKPCRSIDVQELRTGGVNSPSTDSDSASRLAQRIALKRRNLRRSRETAPTTGCGLATVLPFRGGRSPSAG